MTRLPGYDDYLARLTDEHVEGEEDEQEQDVDVDVDVDVYDDDLDVCDQYWSP